jgi:glycosyltransferase involved in cell wall biosynthesis
MLPNQNTKIFFVNKFNWLDAAPMSIVSTFFTHALAELGHDTTLIIRGEPAADVHAILKKRFSLEHLRNYEVKLFSRSESPLIKTSSDFYWKALRHIISHRQNNQKTIVISRNTTFLPYLALLKKRYGVKTIFEAHGYHGRATLPGLPPRPARSDVRLSGQYRFIERIFLNKIDGLVCITSPQKELYEQDFIRIPAIFLSLGAGAGSNSPSETEANSYHHKKLCYVGRLTSHINPHLIFEALNIVAERSISFVWVGLRPEDFRVLEKEIKKYDLEQKVELKGWLPHSEMSRYTKGHVSVGLAAYKPTFRSAAVTSPSKIFDYFAAGLPVIAPRMPTVKDIIMDGENGLLFTPDDPESLADAITAVFANRETYERLKKASVESAREFSWQNRAQKMMDFVDGL